MKTLLAAAAALSLLPAAALAQTEGPREAHRVVVAGPGMHMDIGEDGLTRDQFLARHAEMFARMDADGDGRVTREELQSHHQARIGEHGGPGGLMRRRGGGHHGPMLMMRHGEGEGEGRPGRVIELRHGGDSPGLDADGDGRISLDEMTAPMRRHFEEMDRDNSGFLEAGERGHGARLFHHRAPD